MKAPKGRCDVRARGASSGSKQRHNDKALTGRRKYVALSGLDESTGISSCGVATGYYISLLRSFSNCF